MAGLAGFGTVERDWRLNLGRIMLVLNLGAACGQTEADMEIIQKVCYQIRDYTGVPVLILHHGTSIEAIVHPDHAKEVPVVPTGRATEF